MSCSICWRPMTVSKKTFPGTSTMWDTLIEVFTPISNKLVLSGPNVLLLRAMQAANPANGFYKEIADAIEKHGSIEVWAEY